MHEYNTNDKYNTNDVLNVQVSSASCVLMGWMFNVLSLVTPLLVAMLGVLRTVSVYKSVWFRNKVSVYKSVWFRNKVLD